MNPTERILYAITLALFLLAFYGMFRRWCRSGDPQVKFAGRVFLLVALAMAVGYWWLR